MADGQWLVVYTSSTGTFTRKAIARQWVVQYRSNGNAAAQFGLARSGFRTWGGAWSARAPQPPSGPTAGCSAGWRRRCCSHQSYKWSGNPGCALPCPRWSGTGCRRSSCPSPRCCSPGQGSPCRPLQHSVMARHYTLMPWRLWRTGLTISELLKHSWRQAYFEGSRPEWCISTTYHAWDTPFWLGTLDIMLEIHHSGREPSIYYFIDY